MLAVTCVYAGFLPVLAGVVWLLCPVRFQGVRTRGRGAVLAVLGLGLVLLGWSLPAREVRIARPRTRLDEFAPTYQFHEVHSLRVEAPPERVFRATKAVTAEEIRFFRTLVWIRRFGRPGPESILNPSERLPLLEVATRTTFLQLAEEPDREIVVGTVVIAPTGTRRDELPATPGAYQALQHPVFAKATMNFLIEPVGAGGSRVSTETRVFATDAASRRRFAAYWRTIYPGSALIRRMWLAAIKRRAEGPGDPGARAPAPASSGVSLSPSGPARDCSACVGIHAFSPRSARRHGERLPCAAVIAPLLRRALTSRSNCFRRRPAPGPPPLVV